MQTYVLVAYASKYGATKAIAEKIGEVINASGLVTDVEAVEQVREIKPYTAVVLGSAVYAGQWLGEANAFLRAHEFELRKRPVWLFSSGPTGDGNPMELLHGWQLPEGQRLIAEHIQPRDVALFHGALEFSRLNFAEKLIVKGSRVPLGDYRDWQVITQWAVQIADALTAVKA